MLVDGIGRRQPLPRTKTALSHLPGHQLLSTISAYAAFIILLPFKWTLLQFDKKKRLQAVANVQPVSEPSRTASLRGITRHISLINRLRHAHVQCDYMMGYLSCVTYS